MPPSRAGRDPAGATVLDEEFGAATLSGLRGAVFECAAAAGLAGERAVDVMLALHELAANVVRHGAGRGRLLMQLSPRALHCRVSDAGADAAGQAAARPASWPVEHGHGLWLVGRTADQVRASTSPAGSVVSVVFDRPAS